MADNYNALDQKLKRFTVTIEDSPFSEIVANRAMCHLRYITLRGGLSDSTSRRPQMVG
jgi:hypothetical protein